MINRRNRALFWILALAPLAFVALSAQAQVATQTNPNFEYGVDRPGGDYRNFELQFDAPGLCAGQCAQEAQCRAWTYVKPGVQGPKARCWLKNVVPPPVQGATFAISGLRGTTAQPPVPPPTRVAGFVGCFKDTSDFDLKGHLERSAQNSPQRCISVCQAKGFAYAGVQYGESCLCGNSYGKYGAANNCNMACTGDRGQVCGGYGANSVYATGVTVARPPPPPPVTPPVTPPVAGGGAAALKGLWAFGACNGEYGFLMGIEPKGGATFEGVFENGNGDIKNGLVSGNQITFDRVIGPNSVQRYAGQLVNEGGRLKMSGLWTGAYQERCPGRNNWTAAKR